MSKPYEKIKNKTDSLRCNCVLWARQFCPSLPRGLWTLADKKKIINSKKAKKGSVAILDVGGSVGHVALVSFAGRNHITIREANFKSCTITERHDTEKKLKIIGYFKP